jgi:fatty-acyl-CoA synthase
MAVRTSTKTAAAYAYPLLIKQLLLAPLQNASDQVIIYKKSMRYTYADLSLRVSRLANLLEHLGVTQGSCVAVMDWDSHRYLEAYFAVPMAGAVLQTVNIRLSSEQISYTLAHAEAEVVFVNLDFLPVLESIRDELPMLKKIVLLTDDETQDSSAYSGEYETLLSTMPESYDFPDFSEDAVATRFYTTGTTGKPKAVSFTHRQLVLYTLATAAALASAPQEQRLGYGDVYMPITPMFHVHAWGLPFVATLLGLKQVYPGRYIFSELLELKHREQVTFSHCVPTVMQMLLGEQVSSGIPVKGWKMLIGGAALTPALAQRALDVGIEVWAGGGMSETCAATFVTRVTPCMETEEAMRARCHTGLPIPLVQVRVVDEDMNDLPHDAQTTGELVIRAPWLTESYAGDERASEDLWRGGYLHTQDIGHISADGYVQITDRLKDVIKSGGEWISSLHVETLIASIPGVQECAVVGIPDIRWGERPCALIVKDTGTTLEHDNVISTLRQAADSGQLSRFAIPEQVHFVESLPKTSVGKTDKRAIRYWLEERASTRQSSDAKKTKEQLI